MAMYKQIKKRYFIFRVKVRKKENIMEGEVEIPESLKGFYRIL